MCRRCAFLCQCVAKAAEDGLAFNPDFDGEAGCADFFPSATDNNDGGKWIPVTERLPVDWCPVLVMVRGVGEPLLGSYRENVWFHERWNTTFIDGAVTHWMPLPEPPKEVKR